MIYHLTSNNNNKDIINNLYKSDDMSKLLQHMI